MQLTPHKRLLTALLLGALAGLSAASGQTDRSDPTVPPAALADTLRAQLAELRAVTLRALVVGTDNTGIALLVTGKGRPLTAAESAAQHGDASVVRAGAALLMDADGIPVRLAVKSVTADGVEIDAPTLSEKLFIPGSFKAAPAPAGTAPGFLRHLECDALPLETVLRLIADQTGANISPSSQAAQEPVSVFLRNLSAESAVEEICRSRNLWYRKDDAADILRVTTMEEYEKDLSSFREETTESFTLLYPNVIEVASVIYGLYPERVMLSLGEDDILKSELDDLSQRFDRFNSFSSGSNSGLLKNPLGAISANSGSGGSGLFTSSEGRTTRIGMNPTDERVRDSFRGLTAGDAKRLDKALRQSDTNAAQQLVGTLREKRASIFVTVSRRNNLIVVRTGDAQVMGNIRDLIRRLDVPSPMVLLEVKVLQLTLSDDFTSSFEYEFNKTYNKNASTPTEATAGFPGFNPLANAARTDAMSFQILSDNLNVRIQMLETEGRVKTLATPMLLTANNEVSRLFIGEERPMVRDLSVQTVVTENADPVITIDPVTEMESVGTMLLITPNINADRTVTLRLLQENSKIVKNDATIPVYSPSGGGVIMNVPVDIASSRTVSGTFVAKDEMTVAAGGLIEETESDQESRIPVLGRIPYLGWFFRSTEKVKSRTELIMLIKPHVISTPSEGESISRRVTEGLSLHPAADGRPSLNTLRPAPPKPPKIPPLKR